MPEYDKFLRKQKILHLATISKNGMPHVVPVWYLYSKKRSMLVQIQKLKKQKMSNVIKK